MCGIFKGLKQFISVSQNCNGFTLVGYRKEKSATMSSLISVPYKEQDEEKYRILLHKYLVLLSRQVRGIYEFRTMQFVSRARRFLWSGSPSLSKIGPGCRCTLIGWPKGY